MKESIHSYFQLGLVSAMAYPYYDSQTSPDVIDVARQVACDPDFAVLELNPIADGEKRKVVRAIAEQAHLRVTYGAHGRLLSRGLNPNDLDEAQRQKAEQALCDGVDEAAELGATGLAFLAGGWSEAHREQHLAQLVKTTCAVCNYAATKGIHVELEVFDFDIDKKAFIGPAALAAEYAARVRCQCNNFGLMVDLSHIPMCYETPEYVIRTLRPYITHFHVGNTVIGDPAWEAYGDMHPRFGYPNSCSDTPQLLEFLRVLKCEGFFCKEQPYILSFEVKPRPDEDPAVIIANSKRVLTRAWAMLED